MQLDNIEESAADNLNPLSPYKFQACWEKFADPGYCSIEKSVALWSILSLYFVSVIFH